MSRGYLLLCFGDKAWGRAASGRALGAELRSLGREVSVVAGGPGLGAYEGSGLAVEALPDLSGGLLGLYLEDLLERLDPACVVFCDGDRVLHALRRLRVDPEILRRTGACVLGVDTWRLAVTGDAADLFGDQIERFEAWPSWLIPVANPIAWDAGVAACARAQGERPYALVSTAPWQHERLDVARGAVVQREVPALLAQAVGAVDGLDVVHVGPEPLEGLRSLGPRYRWQGPLSPSDYQSILARSAVYISLSPVCSTQAKALAAGVPVVLLQNLASAPDDRRLPYHFRVWPLGYARFLEPLLRSDPLSGAVTACEVCRPESVAGALRSLAFDGPARRKVLARQAVLVAAAKALPSVADEVISLAEVAQTI